MGGPEGEPVSAPEPPAAPAELIWLIANRSQFLTIARDYHQQQGRGALVIEVAGEELSEDTPFSYAPQAHIASQEDHVSQQLARIVDIYNPEDQFVAVCVHPGAEFSFTMYQIKAGETGGVWGEPGQPGQPSPDPDRPVPDLDTLMEWEAEGGCEATDGCWVETDGACPHGHQSWLLKLGLI